VSSSETFNQPTIYHQLIGSLMYLVNTRLDIRFVLKSLSQFMVDLQRVHWIVVKHFLWYLRGTMEYWLLYESSGGVILSGFTDVDWAGCTEGRKSSSGFFFGIGSRIIS
jgi:hypothetical protein